MSGLISYQTFSSVVSGLKALITPVSVRAPLPVTILNPVGPSPFDPIPITNTITGAGVWPVQGGIFGGSPNPFRPTPGRAFNISFINDGMFIGSFYIARQFQNGGNFPVAGPTDYMAITNFGIVSSYTGEMSEVFIDSESNVSYVAIVTYTSGSGRIRFSQ